MKCINYKTGGFIPAGTEVYRTKIIYDKQFSDSIYFKVADSKKEYKMRFNTMWHRGKTIENYKDYLFTKKTFEQQVEGMSEKEIEAIKHGKIVVGMSKRAVLVSYGRPPEHRTPDLKSNRWRYWMNRIKQKTICFDKGLTVRCIDLKKHQEKLTDEL